MPLYLKLITLLMLPITLTSCAKAQGALAPTGDKYDGYGAYLPDQNKSSVEFLQRPGQQIVLRKCALNFTQRFVVHSLAVVSNY